MNEKLLFNQLHFARSLTLKAIKTIPTDLLDEVPNGSTNNLRWQFGHIFTAQSLLVNRFVGIPLQLQDEYISYFAPKTSPDNWKEVPPTIKEITIHLSKQPSEIEQLLTGKLEEKLKKPFLTGTHGEFTTVQEILTFAIYHEGHHLGAINVLKRILGINL
ncbi:hypothetical protein CIB95_08070 [Lottiidibacillus patelloidae]|uniref:DinB-like domain-containing protein n=1 Tax=Lottiidibacillus patelloidae TaxID=2670334 RepID=A0A263BW47_9BACI|nr:DinB family protein [Lottiidibacillus patelloidae]OZM57406.1 hypothetical protein CIB95_08070 [Lottiidibacillus patelloidae]